MTTTPMPFIVGVARSGTTLLRVMLDAHPELHVPAETGFIPAVLARGASASRQAIFEAIATFPTWQDARIDADELRTALSTTEPFAPADGVRAYYRLHAARAGKSRCGDKTPSYLGRLDNIEMLLPEARFVHLIRDGRDVALSLRGQWFAPGDDIATLARHWCDQIQRGRALGHRRRHYLEVRYEDLIEGPEPMLRRICAFLELEFDRRMLEYPTNARQVLDGLGDFRDAQGRMVSSRDDRQRRHCRLLQAPDASRVLRWRADMALHERERFEAVAGPLLAELGYEMKPVPAPPPRGRRVLITNNTLAERAGSELYVFDVATALLSRGCRPVAFSNVTGPVADALRRASVPVADDLASVSETPHIIHGQHHLETMTALARFPDVPAVFFCHGFLPWEEMPPRHPRILRYVAVDLTCRDRLVCEHGIPPERVRLLRNFVDLDRFRPRTPLPPVPRRALVFNNGARPGPALDVVRAACRRRRIELDVAGAGSGNPLAEPEKTLGQYDLVFASARCAIEALAVGTAVVLWQPHAIGPLVTSDRLDDLRDLNFGLRTLCLPPSVEALEREIDRYDARDAAEVSRRLRAVADREAAVDRITALYEEVIAEHSRVPRPDPAAESQAMADYLRRISAAYKQVPTLHKELNRLQPEEQRAEKLQHTVELLTRRLGVAEQELAEFRRLLVVGLRSFVLRIPLLGGLARLAAKGLRSFVGQRS